MKRKMTIKMEISASNSISPSKESSLTPVFSTISHPPITKPPTFTRKRNRKMKQSTIVKFIIMRCWTTIQTFKLLPSSSKIIKSTVVWEPECLTGWFRSWDHTSSLTKHISQGFNWWIAISKTKRKLFFQ
jgi:hypothetical protein